MKLGMIIGRASNVDFEDDIVEIEVSTWRMMVEG